MKTLAVILLLFSSLATCSQVIRFSSPVTQTWPTLFTTNFIEVNRKVSFDLEEITVITEVPTGKEFRIFKIITVENDEGNLFFYCTDLSNIREITIILPGHQEFIDIYEPSKRTGEEIQTRIHII